MDTELLAPAYPILAPLLNGPGSSTAEVSITLAEACPRRHGAHLALGKTAEDAVTMAAAPPPSSPRTSLHEKWVITLTALLLTVGGLIAFGASGHDLTTADRAALVGSASTETWTPPVEGATPSSVVRDFQGPSTPWGPGHRGIDLQTSSDVVAPEDGTVRFVGTVVDRPVLTIEHPSGLLSSFEPVSTEMEVGDAVRRGQVLGSLSGEQHCDVSCVHWGVRIPDGWTVGSTVRDRYIDPGLLLGWSGPAVLWPLQGSPFREGFDFTVNR